VTPFLIDSHCHLHFPAYAEDLDAVLARMRERNIFGITIGTALGNSSRGLGFAEVQPGIWATAGVHPEHFTSDFHDENEGEVEKGDVSAEALEAIARASAKCVGIGETGLDFFRVDEGVDPVEARQKQEAAFRVHLEVARKLDLPLVLHCREALGRLAELFQEEQNAGRRYRAVVHSFTGTWEEAKPLLDLGLSIAVNGIATFPLRKTQRPEEAIDRTIERIPLDRLLLETDAPYLAPAPHRGKRNEPAFVEEVAKHVAAVRKVGLEAVARRTVENTATLFRLPV
jgi:TatD DNase family protein